MESIVQLPRVVSIEFNTVIVEIVAKLVVAVEFTAAATVIVMLIIMLKVMLGIMLIAVIVIGNFHPRHLAATVVTR